MPSEARNKSLRIALLTHAGASKGSQIAEALRVKGVEVALFVFEEKKPPPLCQRVKELIGREGLYPTLRKIAKRVLKARGTNRVETTASGKTEWPPAAAYAARIGLPVLALPDLTSSVSLSKLKAENIDLFIHAGAGILRSDLLSIPRLGTLNAHMGLLPAYRGMNVAEWAALNGDPVGCTIHLIDAGIDTGGIIKTREVPLIGVLSLVDLRTRVDQVQVAALVDTVADIASTGCLPPVQTQRKEEGKQYFTMHPALRALLQARLGETIPVT